MIEIKFKNTLESLLKKDSRLVDENKELNLSMIRELADKLDEQLIQLLLSDKEAKEKFFLKIKDVLVFRHNDFKFFLDENKIDNSYTKYENKIGLSTGGKYLNDIDDVVLNFPYKDCVLQGGQSTEEGTDEYYVYDNEEKKYQLKQAQRKEIFFNEVLAQDEIDRLFEPKAFANIKKYTAKGEEELTEFTRDQKTGLIKDNLIIKGNNLLALHSLKQEFTGEIKLIYIDPPYNTENDTFCYNDSFTHSTWLTFIKNRLEVAKELLKNDGIIFIHIGDEEVHYLKVIADEIFGRNNFVSTVARVAKTASNKGTHFAPSIDFILCYSKQKELLTEFYGEVDKNLYKKTETEGERKGEKYRDNVALYQSSLDPMRGCRNQRYYIEAPDGTLLIPPGEIFPELKKDAENIPPKTAKDKVWRWAFESYKKNKHLLVFKETNTSPLLDENGNKAKYNIYTKSYLSDREESGTKPRNYLDQFINRKGADYIKKLDIKFSYSKPVELIEYLISIVNTKKDDIILDCFAGSGTTAEAVVRLNGKNKGERQFIICEQLDYFDNITVNRVQKIISDSSFIRLELKKWNEEAKEKITDCKSLKELENLLNELSDKYFLNYNVKFKEFKEKIIKEKEFVALPLPKQKEMFTKMLDLNQLYVNANEMEDKKYGLSKENINLTKSFYNHLI